MVSIPIFYILVNVNPVKAIHFYNMYKVIFYKLTDVFIFIYIRLFPVKEIRHFTKKVIKILRCSVINCYDIV